MLGGQQHKRAQASPLKKFFLKLAHTTVACLRTPVCAAERFLATCQAFATRRRLLAPATPGNEGNGNSIQPAIHRFVSAALRTKYASLPSSVAAFSPRPLFTAQIRGS